MRRFPHTGVESWHGPLVPTSSHFTLIPLAACCRVPQSHHHHNQHRHYLHHHYPSKVILIDSAYCVNEYLVEKGYAASSRPGTEDSWNGYLVACLLLSFGLFAAAVML